MFNNIKILKNDLNKITLIGLTGLIYGLIAYFSKAAACGDAITYISSDNYLKLSDGGTEFLFIFLNNLLSFSILKNQEINYLSISIFTAYYFYISNFLFFVFLRIQKISLSLSLSLISLSGLSYSVFLGSCQYARQFIAVIIGFVLIFSLNKDRSNRKDNFINLIMLIAMLLTHSGVTTTLGFCLFLIYLLKKVINLFLNYRLNFIKFILNTLILIVLLALAYYFASAYLYPILTFLNFGYIISGAMIYDDLKIGLISFLVYIVCFFIILKWSNILTKAIPDLKNKEQINKTILNLILISLIIFVIGSTVFPYIYRVMVLKSIWLFFSLALVYEYQKENYNLINQKDRIIILQYKRLSIISCSILFLIEWTNIFEIL